jgi:alkylated DNA repair dioxygenase AlkB
MSLFHSRSMKSRAVLLASLWVFRPVVLRGFGPERSPELIAAIDAIAAVSPFRHMVTPGGWEMSVALTNCGQAGFRRLKIRASLGSAPAPQS